MVALQLPTLLQGDRQTYEAVQLAFQGPSMSVAQQIGCQDGRRHQAPIDLGCVRHRATAPQFPTSLQGDGQTDEAVELALQGPRVSAAQQIDGAGAGKMAAITRP